MPALPCSNCKALVDTQDPFCRKCNDKSPFECSKCSTRLAHYELYEPEKLTFKKSVFCARCGPEEKVVNCHHCRTGLIRSAGRSRIGSSGNELVYHEECWKQYTAQARISQVIFTFGIAGVAIAGGMLAAFVYHDAGKAVTFASVGALITVLVGFVVRPRG